MDNIEKKISEYIDNLNAEIKPVEHSGTINSTEYQELMDTARFIRSLKDPEYPKEDFSNKLVASLKRESSYMKEGRNNRFWITRTFAAAAVIALIIIANIFSPNENVNIVNGMEKAFSDLKAYHGIVEIVEINDAGEEVIQAKKEVWANQDRNYYQKELEGSRKGLVTINNGEKKWQIREDTKQVHIFPAFPDAYRFAFELGKEIENVKNAINVKVIGDESILGRKTSKIEVTPDGGLVYYLWVDKETNLPLQHETAMQNALQYRITYTNIDFVDTIPIELLKFNNLVGYEVVDNNPEQIMDDINAAKETIGFNPIMVKEIPDGYELKTIAIETKTNRLKLYYKNGNNTVIISEDKVSGELKLDYSAMIGEVNSNVAEVLISMDNNEGILTGVGSYASATDISSIRWRENGIEYSVLGNVSIEEIKMFTSKVTNGEVVIPIKDETEDKPDVEAELDMEIEENEQKSVDAGNAPWRLNPAYVTQVFVSLLISPDGIEGEYPISYENITINENSGMEAIATINDENSPASRVYLKRLVREDSTGIWTVVGYDLAK